MLIIFLLVIMTGSACFGWAVCKLWHEERTWHCFCETADYYKCEVERMREERKLLEANTRRYDVPEGVYR